MSNLNNSIIDKETYEKILGALEGLKDMTKKSQQKQAMKTCSDIIVPITLKDALIRLSKDELSGIRKRLEIKSASHLNKGELIELIKTKIPLLLENIFMNMDQEHINIIKKIIQNGGYIEVPKLAAHQVEYFRNSGIIYTGTYEGKKILAMPEEIVKHQTIREFARDS